MKEFLLYITVNTVNGKVYGGKHVGYRTDNYIGSGTAYFLNAVKKHGRAAFIRRWLKLKIKSEKELNTKETRLIRLLKYMYGVNCYNVHEGGSGGYHLMYHPEHIRIAVGKKIGNTKKQKYKEGVTEAQIAGRVKRNEKMRLLYDDENYKNKIKTAAKLRIKKFGSNLNTPKAIKSLKLHGQFKLKYTITTPDGTVEEFIHSHINFKTYHNIEDTVFIIMNRDGQCIIKRRTNRTNHRFPAGTIFKVVEYLNRRTHQDLFMH